MEHLENDIFMQAVSFRMYCQRRQHCFQMYTHAIFSLNFRQAKNSKLHILNHFSENRYFICECVNSFVYDCQND